MQTTGADVDEFLAAVAPERRRRDAYRLRTLMSEISGHDAEMWSGNIVGFGTSHYRYESGTEGDAPILGFSPRKAAMSVYLTPGFAADVDLLARLGPHRAAVSCLYLTDLDKVDAAVLRTLLTDTFRHSVG
jgi:hypothetical protein